MEQIEQAVWNFTPTAECPTLHDAIELVYPKGNELEKWIPFDKARLAEVQIPGEGMVRIQGPEADIARVRQQVEALGVGEVIEGSW